MRARSEAPAAPAGTALDRGVAAGLLLWGVAVWLAVAVSTRLVGHVLLAPGNPLVLLGVFAAVVPLMGLVTYPVYRWLGIDHAARPGAAALLSLPGLVLDASLVLFASRALPEMEAGTVATFGALLLFGYAVVLATGFVPRGRPGSD